LLLCNKICGAAHYNMQMAIIVESQEDYDKWLAEQKPFLADESPVETTEGAVVEETAAEVVEQVEEVKEEI